MMPAVNPGPAVTSTPNTQAVLGSPPPTDFVSQVATNTLTINQQVISTSLRGSLQTAVIFGDSRTQYNFDQSAIVLNARPRWWNYLQALSGQAFTLLNNAGVAGATTDGMANQVNSSGRGVGFGAIGSVGNAPKTNPGVLPFSPNWIFFMPGFNNLVVSGQNWDQAFPPTKAIMDQLWPLCSRLVIHSCPADAAADTGWTPAKMAQMVLYNNALRDYAKSIPNCVFVDLWSVLVDTTSATQIQSVPTYLGDNRHENNLGGYLEGKAIYAAIGQYLSRPNDVLPSSNAATITVDSNIPQLMDNPLLAGTAAISATGYSGNTAGSNLGNTNFVRGGAATAVLSAVTRADGYGQDIQVEATFAARADSLEIRFPDQSAKIVAGATYIAVCHCTLKGAGGIALTSAQNMTIPTLSIQATIGGVNNFTTFMTGSTGTTESPLPESLDNLVYRTLPITIGSVLPTVFRMNFGMASLGAGSAQIRVGRVAIYRIA